MAIVWGGRKNRIFNSLHKIHKSHEEEDNIDLKNRNLLFNKLLIIIPKETVLLSLRVIDSATVGVIRLLSELSYP